MRRILAAAAATALLALSACGSDEEPAAPAPTPSAETSDSPTADVAAAQQEIAVDETIEDDVLGHTIKVTGLVRDFTAPSNTGVPDDGGEWVLVEVDVTAGDKFSGGVQGGFSLLSEGDLAGPMTGIIDDDMDAAGYAPWEPADSGEQTKGWVAFQVNTRADTYEVQYKRLAASVIGGGDPIPEKIWTIELPTT